MPPSRISLLSVRPSLALFADIKLLRRRFISDPEVHLMGSERIGFFVIFLAVAKSRPHAVLFLEALLLSVPVPFRSSCINLRTH